MDHHTRTELRRSLQSALIVLGHDLGPTGADGRMGPYTASALRALARSEEPSRTLAPTQRTELHRLVQSTLLSLGYSLGPHGADGRIGPDTRAALHEAAGDWPAVSRRTWSVRCECGRPLLVV